MKEIAKRWLRVDEAAEYVGMKRGSLYNGTSKKSKKPFPVRPKRLGRKILFDVHELDQYLESI
jgi:predicted DNA-binding transcriptional regulator AlpA